MDAGAIVLLIPIVAIISGTVLKLARLRASRTSQSAPPDVTARFEALWAMISVGFAEETVFRGYMFERLGKLFGSGVGAKASIVLLTSGWFGLSHYAGQGLAGAEQATIVGLVFGTIFAVTGRIWMLMVAHSVFDLTALAIIYWDLETAVAHLIFK